MKKIILLSLAVLLIGCDDSKNSDGSSKNSDGSSKTTASSCQIISSSALWASDRAHDLQQCWPMTQGWGNSDRDLALNWCNAKATEYMGDRYLVGHSIQIQVASTFCPK